MDWLGDPITVRQFIMGLMGGFVAAQVPLAWFLFRGYAGDMKHLRQQVRRLQAQVLELSRRRDSTEYFMLNGKIRDRHEKNIHGGRAGGGSGGIS